MKDLKAVRARLLEVVENDARFSIINSRLILRTGINLRLEDAKADPGDVGKVLDALKQMGIDLAAARS